jgi:hypothetical protein
MSDLRYIAGFLGLAAFAFTSCSSGSSGSSAGGSSFDLSHVGNGFGQLLPHQVKILGDDGEPTSNITSIRSDEDLLANVRVGNQILPTPVFDSATILPSGAAGNHFLLVKFTEPVSFDSVMSNLPGMITSNSLTGTVIVLQVDPATGQATPIKGRAFINGWTYGSIAATIDPVTGEVYDSPRLFREHWVAGGADELTALAVRSGTPGLGFPGTEHVEHGTFSGAHELVTPSSFVFIIDEDEDLSTHETFPTGVDIQVRMTTGVKGVDGKSLARSAVISTTVGSDTITPEIRVSPPPHAVPLILPGGGARDVDPMTTIRVEYSEPLQPTSVGNLPLDGSVPSQSPAVTLAFGPDTSRVQVPFTAMPVSVFDLTTYLLTPAFHFPGEGPVNHECGVYNRVDVTVNAQQILDLAGNTNTLPATTFFETGEGPGLVNAPVAPEAIYLARLGATPGLSVIDLNGFGGGTGNPNFDFSFATFTEGNTNFPNNSNVKLQGTLMRPPLQSGTCTVDGGSSGVFTLVRDTSLSDLLIRAPMILRPDDMMLGHALDMTFNNAPAPFGCQSGGGNLCAQNAQKVYQVIQGGPNTLTPPILNNPILNTVIGGENTISWAPSPNPPPLIFPPLCVSPFIGGMEPTSVDTVALQGLQNLLVPGDPFGDPNNGLPPEGLLSAEQNAWFQGPPLPKPVLSACIPYMFRQQIGQFLYVIDRARNEIVVLNSNRMTVIDRIGTPDPTTLAMSPNLDFLAIANQSVRTVSFIDINPTSATFHTVVHTAVVGTSPRGIAWEPGNEDVLVCNEGESTISIISAWSLEVRKTLSSQLFKPFDLVITPRQNGFGFQRQVYFAYIMNRNGQLAIFESGPNSVNGWGFDDIIGTAPQKFQNPKTIHADLVNINSAVWIVHEGPIDPETNEAGPVGHPAVTNLKIESALFGALNLNVNSLLIPQFRDMALAVDVSLGPDVLSGVPVDVAFDNLRNFGGLPNFTTTFGAGSPVILNGKSLVRQAGFIVQNTCEPRFMFVAIPSPTVGSDGMIDVIDIGGGYTKVDVSAFRPGDQSIEVTDVSLMMDYFKQ